MRHEEISDELRNHAFEFFYWFSRFEFALKECAYLRDKTPGAKAEACWRSFIKKWEGDYQPTAAASALIAANPQRQVIDASGAELTFVSLDFKLGASDLERVVRLAQVVRNNLFHGGKHGAKYWDDPQRICKLLPMVVTVLGELAQSTDLEGDFLRYY